MAPKEPTRAQLSSRLAYSQNTPAFLQKLQNQIAGRPNRDDYEEYEDDEGDEWEYDGSGRPPIPKRPQADANREGERPPIPERPADDPGSADEDDEDEKPQVVVLKQGKHLTEWEAENVRRAERGLSPLPDPSKQKSNSNNGPASSSKDGAISSKKSSKAAKPSLSFSTTSGTGQKAASKRKAVTEDIEEEGTTKGPDAPTKKKAKKSKNKALLSFGDDA